VNENKWWNTDIDNSFHENELQVLCAHALWFQINCAKMNMNSFVIKILWFCYIKNDYFIQLQFRFKFHHLCSLAIELTLLLLAKSKKPHTIAEKDYYWTSYTSKQYTITLNCKQAKAFQFKLSLFFSSKFYVILFDVHCRFCFKCFKSVIVADSLSALLAMSTGDWKQHSIC